MESIRRYVIESWDKYRVYCDLDGVLTDFIEAFKKHTGLHPKQVDKFWTYIEGNESYWSAMRWMPGGKLLWTFIKQFNPTILTAPIRDASCISGKNKWVDKNLGYTIPRIIESQKQKYANPTAILIDDTKEKIDAWVKAGGIGILHKNAAKTIKDLKRLIGMR